MNSPEKSNPMVLNFTLPKPSTVKRLRALADGSLEVSSAESVAKLRIVAAAVVAIYDSLLTVIPTLAAAFHKGSPDSVEVKASFGTETYSNFDSPEK